MARRAVASSLLPSLVQRTSRSARSEDESDAEAFDALLLSSVGTGSAAASCGTSCEGRVIVARWKPIPIAPDIMASTVPAIASALSLQYHMELRTSFARVTAWVEATWVKGAPFIELNRR